MRPSWVLRTVEDGAVVRYRFTVCDHSEGHPYWSSSRQRLVCTFCHGTVYIEGPSPQGIKVERMSDDEEE